MIECNPGQEILVDDIIHEINNKEDSLGNPSENGQILSSETDGTRNWIDLQLPPQIPHFNPGDFMTATISGSSQRIFGLGSSDDTVYVGTVDANDTGKIIARGQWDFQGSGLVKTKQENSTGEVVGNMVKMTQTEYDSITPESNTFYIIVG